MTQPEANLNRLQEHIIPGSTRRPHLQRAPEPWTPPDFEDYEAIRTWLKESVMSALLYERYPDGRWTMELLLKEPNPGTPRYLVL